MKTDAADSARGIVVAGLSGGSGKSVVAVGLAAAYAGQGRRVVPFKKGPDYIDAGWLQLAAGQPCYNLDPYLMSRPAMLRSFGDHCRTADIVILEGNRGLYDGVDLQGGYSTAELAVILELPVLLVVDCTKTTRTVAAMVLGCRELDHRVKIGGVVLNRIGTSRHETMVRQAVEHYTGIPVLGALPRQRRDFFPQRHLGITPYQEHAEAHTIGADLAELVAKHLDLPAIARIMGHCHAALGGQEEAPVVAPAMSGGGRSQVRIGVFRDAAFQFYYPDNLEALVRAGAVLVEIDALRDPVLPELEALYIGGGFPETSAAQLAANQTFRESVRQRAAAGLPIYAECGGLIYLGESITLDGQVFPLAGVLPVRFGLAEKPQAHGYTILEAIGANPYYPLAAEIKGHEFRYSRVLAWQGQPADLVFAVKRGVGFAGGRDGLVHKNVLALYTHVHALGTPQWAGSLVEKARQYQLSVINDQ